MLERDAQITIIIGRNGTGKSTFAEKLMKRLRQRAVVVTYSGMPKIWRPYTEIDPRKAKSFQFKKGIRQIVAARWEQSRTKNDVFKYVYNNYHDGAVIFDDCRGYIHGNVDNDQYFRQLILDFRHRMLDLYFVVHTPSDVPPKVWGFASTIWVGSTDSMLDKGQIKIGSADRIIAAQQQVNEVFLKAKAKKDNSHYGIFKKITT